MGLENSDYDGKPGYKILTKEEFKGSELKITDQAIAKLKPETLEEIKAGTFKKFHTTRTALVNQLNNSKLLDDLKAGKVIGPVKCHYVAKPKKGGNPYWEIVDAT